MKNTIEEQAQEHSPLSFKPKIFGRVINVYARCPNGNKYFIKTSFNEGFPHGQFDSDWTSYSRDRNDYQRQGYKMALDLPIGEEPPVVKRDEIIWEDI
jgi:hypothetical protein